MNIQFPHILQLDITGQPRQWMNYEDAAVQYAKGNVAWELGELFTLHGGMSRLLGIRTTMDIKTIIAIRGADKNKNFRITPRLTNRALFARDEYMCAYCPEGRIFPTARLTRDHIHPISKGGKNIWKNVVTACKPCNTRKDNKDISDTNMTLNYIPYAPDRAEHLISQNRNILVDQMDYLKKMITNKNSRILLH